MESDAFETEKYWEGQIILHGLRHNARGVAILFKKNFEYSILHSEKDTEGNMILLDLKVSEITIRLINIYGPNTNN